MGIGVLGLPTAPPGLIQDACDSLDAAEGPETLLAFPNDSAPSSQAAPPVTTSTAPTSGSATLGGSELSASGLGIVGFGDDRSLALANLRGAFGIEPVPTASLQGLDGYNWTFGSGEDFALLTAYFRGDEFVGYHLSGSATADLDLHTVDGVGLGTFLSDLQSIYGDDLWPSPTGYAATRPDGDLNISVVAGTDQVVSISAGELQVAEGE